MEIIKSLTDIRKWRKEQRKKGLTIAFVPTMGALHEGHHQLVKRARKIADRVILSLFINPIQFNEAKDYKRYPRSLEEDLSQAEEWGVDTIFMPSADEFYPKEFSTKVSESDLSQPLCGKSRPGHFDGVLTVLIKFFHLLEPQAAIFGQKDMQQYLVIQRMVQDFNMDIEIELCPIVRDHEGLAISSRNMRLKKPQKNEALALNEALFMAKIAIQSGERNAAKLKRKIRNYIQSQKRCKIDYVEIVDTQTLQNMNKLKGSVMIALAVSISKVRLIDNLIVNV